MQSFHGVNLASLIYQCTRCRCCSHWHHICSMTSCVVIMLTPYPIQVSIGCGIGQTLSTFIQCTCLSKEVRLGLKDCILMVGQRQIFSPDSWPSLPTRGLGMPLRTPLDTTVFPCHTINEAAREWSCRVHFGEGWKGCQKVTFGMNTMLPLKGVDRSSQRGLLKLHVGMHSEPKLETILVK